MKRWEIETAHGKLPVAYDALLAERNALQARISELESGVRESQERMTKREEQLREAHRSAGKFRRDPARRRGERRKAGKSNGEGSWARRAEPTAEEQAGATEKHAPLTCCPDCRDEVIDVRTQRSSEVDIPVVQPVWTTYITESGYFVACDKRFQSRHEEQIPNAAGVSGVHLGPQVKALASHIKHRLGISYETIAGLMETHFGLKVTRSGLYQADMRLAQTAEPIYLQLLELLRSVLQLHVHETGWRIGTASAWLWVFCGKDISVFTIHTSRGQEVILNILAGYLISDGALAYETKALSSSILRNLAKLSESSAVMHTALAAEATIVPKDALSLAKRRADLLPEDFSAQVATIEDRLDAVIATHFGEDDDDGQRMAPHLAKHRSHLLSFFHVDGVQGTNNPAERELRPAIPPRNTGGCNRTEARSPVHAVLASIGATCRRRKISVIDFLVTLQRSAEPPSILAPFAGPAG